MTTCLLIGPPQEGGEGVYVRELFDNPPDGVRYELSQRFHAGTPSARCDVVHEMLLNQLVHPHLRFAFGFRALTVTGDVDLVHVHSHPVRIRANSRVPVVMSAGSSHYINVRDYERWPARRIRRRYAAARAVYRGLGVRDELLATRRVSRIYTFSEWARRIYVEHGVPSWKVAVIPPGFDIPVVEARAPRQDAGVRFLFVGRDFERKGGPAVLSAFRELRRAHPAASLTIVTRGADEVEVHREEIESGAVRVLEFMDRETLYRAVYPSADIFVMPTLAEGWGFTIAEAMSFGLPVITTNINAMPEIVEDGRTGTLVPPGDARALGDAMDRLAASGDLRAEMGERGRERFVRHFSRPVQRERLAALYREAMTQ